MTAPRPLVSAVARLVEIDVKANRLPPTGDSLTDGVNALEARPTVRITLEIGCGPGDYDKAAGVFDALAGKRGPLQLTLTEVTGGSEATLSIRSGPTGS